MSQITWRNVSGGGSGAIAANKSKANSIKTILGAFDPLEKILKDRTAINEQNWDAQAAQNTRAVKAQLQGIGTLGELNQKRDEGLISESAFNEQFGAQYDPTVVKEVSDARRQVLQQAALNEAMPTALALADEKQDLGAATSILEKQLANSGMQAPKIRESINNFMTNNAAREKQYTQGRQENLLKAVNSVDMNTIKGPADIAANTNAMIESGINVDPIAYQAAMEDRLVDKRTDLDYKQRQAEKARVRQQRNIYNQTRQSAMAAVHQTGDINSINQIIEKSGLDGERKNSMYGALLPVLRQTATLSPQQELLKNRKVAEYNANLQNQTNKRSGFISAQRENLATQNGLAPQVMQRVQKDVAANKDPYIDGLAEDDREILAGYETKLQHGTIEGGDNKGKQFGFGPAEAKTILAITLEQFRGRDTTTDLFGGLLPGEDAKLNKNKFNQALAKTAEGFRNYTEDSKKLDTLEAKWGHDQRKNEQHRDNYEAGLIMASSKSNLTGKKHSAKDFLKSMGATIPDSLIKPIEEDQDYLDYVNSMIPKKSNKSNQAEEVIRKKVEAVQQKDSTVSKGAGRKYWDRAGKVSWPVDSLKGNNNIDLSNALKKYQN